MASETTLRSQIWVPLHMPFSQQQSLPICPTLFSFFFFPLFSLTQTVSVIWLALQVYKELNQQHCRSCKLQQRRRSEPRNQVRKGYPHRSLLCHQVWTFRYSEPVTLRDVNASGPSVLKHNDSIFALDTVVLASVSSRIGVCLACLPPQIPNGDFL